MDNYFGYGEGPAIVKWCFNPAELANLPFEEFVLAMGGTWKYNDATGIYGVTVGGCGACFINEQ